MWWRPLWDYVYSVCDDFISEDRWNNGHSNGGELFTEDEARKIAARLLRTLKSGDAEAYGKLYEIQTKDDEHQYPFHTDNVKEFANFCKDSGGFEIR